MQCRCLLVFLVASVTSVSAQTPLVYSADSLRAVEDQITISNPTNNPVRIDSLGIVYGKDSYGSWLVDMESEGSSGSVWFLEEVSPPIQEVGLDVAPEGSAMMRVRFDPCPVCRSLGGPVDTLLVYTGGIQTPDTLFLNTKGVVGLEDELSTHPLGIATAPNPTMSTTTLSLALAAPARVRIVVYDALGREVSIVHDGPTTDGTRFRVATTGLPTGTYLVRATTASGASATAGLTVVR